jgi:diguanylate cyclase (GGDEF)-like protein/PAS domain S-box-containing protein
MTRGLQFKGAKIKMRSYSVRTWITQGTYPRLFLLIISIILLVTMVRYHLMLGTELEEARQHQRTQLQATSHYLLNRLAQLDTKSGSEIQDSLDHELGFNPELQSLQWSQDGKTWTARAVPKNTTYTPAWFASWAELAPMRVEFPIQSAGGAKALLSVEVGGQEQINRIWELIGAQMRITALNIFTIFFLLILLLRANAGLLKRLNTATSNFRSGLLNTRMVERGTLEMRAVAQTFNCMAAEIQNLVHSLEAAKNTQAEQLHFTEQFINALPLPVFVRGQDGICLGVNQAWEEFFQLRAQTVVGSPFPSDFIAVAEAGAARRAPEKKPNSNEILVRVGQHDLHEMAYYKAPFTHIDGSRGGTICALVDITARKLAEEALLEEKERAVVTLSSIADGVITTDLHGRVDSINQSAQFLTGFSEAQARGIALISVFRLDALSQELPRGTKIEELHATDTAVHAVNQLLLHRSGERYAIEFTAAPIRKADGTVVGCVLVFRDVTQTHELQHKISWQARHDPLTGLNNRDALSERLTHSVYQARQSNRLLGVCLLDLDHFQAINEVHGNWTADRLLKEVALRLQGFVAESADVARLGGDEFVVLLPDLAAGDSIQTTVRALLDHIAQPYAIDGESIFITASAGVVVFPHDDSSPDILLRHADQAMYQAKQAGRGGLHLFDAQQDQEVQTNFTRLAELAQALRQNEFLLHFQPKVNMRTGAIVGAEALLRWQHPTRGLLGPADFLPWMEHTDLIVETGEWVLQQALHQLQAWAIQGHSWVISVNIAARHFHRTDFVDRLKILLTEYPRAPIHQLELEILESAALQDIPHMREVMQACQTLGVCFALDDFGTGFSSLSYLKRLPAETIKIDRMFVDGLLDDEEDATLITAIVGLAGAFGRTVIAEGVETPAQANKLLELGCDLGQGYGIARPMPAADMAPWARGFNASSYVRVKGGARPA